MFPVYILEDNDEQREFYKSIIINTKVINEYAMDIFDVSSVKSFFDIFSETQYGLFFLDMEIDKDTRAGLKLAEWIRTNIPNANIVFVTTHEELSFLTLERKVSPMDYVLKDFTIEKIKSHIVDDVILSQKYYDKDIYTKRTTFGYKIGSKYFSLPMDELILLYTDKSLSGQVNLISKDRRASFPGNLNYYEKKYDNLLRVDKSSLVNKSKMISYDSNKRILYLENNLDCNVSLRRASLVRKRFK
ncbi:response regulator [Companilactobacillus kimchii]|uniref:Response regulator plnd n=2 Tax=Companilactobacillus kimchii TaxID=2801452 RepID=A0ABR5NUD0_9LACO|nr:response regulator [Companilactobacillus kimchii]KAE9557327.1 hypothetical protein ATN91_04065 [Companilactobacillus kimchii]KRK52433.1 response regulator plnd [Companilactobacillus kimchii DSM 13961 = JCM 10707]OWF32549.1 Accessory regulator [Companilactobacillus kimchii]GEO47350.1 DNA-binding response regulator [Companilactobacillus paralimentarius]